MIILAERRGFEPREPFRVHTLSKHNVNYPDDVYGALKDLGIKSYELNIASDTAQSISLAPTESQSIRFMTRVFDLWFEEDDPTVYIRIFHNVIRSLLGLRLNDCSFVYNRCREYVACDELGDLYTCGRFLKEKEAYIGSCTDESLPKILNCRATSELYDRVSRIHPQCNHCDWLGACGGGCAYQRWLNGGFGAPFPQCGIRKALFTHIADRVEPFLRASKPSI